MIIDINRVSKALIDLSEQFIVKLKILAFLWHLQKRIKRTFEGIHVNF